MKVRYTGPFDEVEVPGANAPVKRGDLLYGPDDILKGLLAQSDWEPADEDAKAYADSLAAIDEVTEEVEPDATVDEVADALGKLTIAQLRDYAAAHDIDLGDASLKADLIRIITTSEEGA